MDEAPALEYCSFHPQPVERRAGNVKTIRPEDLALVGSYLVRTIQTPRSSRCNEAACRVLCISGEGTIRIGHGFDVCAFSEVGPIIIDGTRIPYEKGLLAHPDGDVALHALTDALLGAATLGGIGRLFSDVDLAFKGIGSRELSREAWQCIQAKGYTLSNMDVVVIAQTSKMLPHIPQMRVFITEDLDCHTDDVNVRATTTEKPGSTGRGEGIAREAVVLLLRATK